MLHNSEYLCKDGASLKYYIISTSFGECVAINIGVLSKMGNQEKKIKSSSPFFVLPKCKSGDLRHGGYK